MNTYICVFLIILVIAVVFVTCFSFCFLKKFLKQKGRTKIKEEFKLFKFFEFNFEVEHDDSKK